MNIFDTLRAAQGGKAIDNLAKSFRIAPAQADAVLAAVVPELARTLERQTLSRGGLADLVSALGHGHHAAYLENRDLIGNAAAIDDGNAILGHILGSKDASRGVAQRAAATSGVAESIIKMMLPVIAGWVMAGLSKAASGGLGDILGKMGGAGGGMPFPMPGGGGSGTPGPQSGGGGGFGMPDLPRMPDGGGIAMPQGGGGSPPRQMPAGGGSIPEQRIPGFPGNPQNPYGDLSDILRRGGGISVPGSAGGGGSVGGGILWSLVRSILGGALGFQSKGIMGWLFRLVVMRFGWGLLRTILGRTLLGR